MKKEHLEIILEDMNSKFDIIIEGYTALGKKIDGVAVELRAHRADTDAHQGVYRVKES